MKEILRIRDQERFYSVSILSKHFVLSNWDDDEIDEVDLFNILEDHSHFTSHLINHIFFYYHLINHVIYTSSHQSRHLQTHLISYVIYISSHQLHLLLLSSHQSRHLHIISSITSSSNSSHQLRLQTHLINHLIYNSLHQFSHTMKIDKMKKSNVLKKWELENEEDDSDHSKTWKLFDIFSTSLMFFICDASSLEFINKTYSSRYVYLSNYWLERIVKFDLVASFRSNRWLEDFKHKEHIQSTRQSKESTYYIKNAHDRLCYAVVDECYQLHEFEDAIQELAMIKWEIELSNANKKVKEENLVMHSRVKPTSVSMSISSSDSMSISSSDSTSIFKSVSKSISTSISAQIFTFTTISAHMSAQTLSQTYSTSSTQLFVFVINKNSNLKRRIIDENLNSRISVKRTRIEDKKRNDIDVILMLISEDENKKSESAQELEDTRLMCEFLYEIARNQKKILIDLDQQYKEIIEVKKYIILKKKCRKIFESISFMIRTFLESYSNERKMFKAFKDS